MSNLLPENYKGWIITLADESHGCSGFSFEIISPEGEHHRVKMGGHTADDARQRAKEMIDMELAFSDEG